MKRALVLIALSLAVLTGAVLCVGRLHKETQSLLNVTLEIIDAIETGDREHAMVLSQWAYARITGTKAFWNVFVAHTQTDVAVEWLAALQSALRYSDMADAHKSAKLLYEKLKCLDSDALFSFDNLL